MPLSRKRKKNPHKSSRRKSRKAPLAPGTPTGEESISLPALATKPFPTLTRISSSTASLFDQEKPSAEKSTTPQKFDRAFSQQIRDMEAENEAQRNGADAAAGIGAGAASSSSVSIPSMDRMDSMSTSGGLLAVPGLTQRRNAGTSSRDNGQSSPSSFNTSRLQKHHLPTCPINFTWDPEIGTSYKPPHLRKLRLMQNAGKRDPDNLQSSPITIKNFIRNTLSDVSTSRQFAVLVKDHFNDELEIMKTIWLWIGAYVQWDSSRVLNAVSLHTVGESDPNETPETVMKNKQAGTEGIVNTIVELSRKCGIRAKKICGYAKLPGYRPGQRLFVNHVWNAVYIDKKWYLLDLVAGLLSSTSTERFTIRISKASQTSSSPHVHKLRRSVTRPKLNDYYLMCPPKKFLMDHLPLEDRWQLMDPPIKLEDFDAQVYASPHAQKLNVTPHSVDAYQNVIRTNNYLRLTFHTSKNDLVKFMVKVTPLSSITYQDHNYSVIQRLESKRLTFIHVLFPYIGAYRVSVYVARKRSKQSNAIFAAHSPTSQSIQLSIPTAGEFPSLSSPTNSHSDEAPNDIESPTNKKNMYLLGFDYIVHASECLPYQVGFMKSLVGWQSSSLNSSNFRNPDQNHLKASFSNFASTMYRLDFHIIFPAQHKLLWRHTVSFKIYARRTVFKEVALLMNPHQRDTRPDYRVIPWNPRAHNTAEGNVMMILPKSSVSSLPFIVQLEALEISTGRWKTLGFYECVDSLERINHDHNSLRTDLEVFQQNLLRDKQKFPHLPSFSNLNSATSHTTEHSYGQHTARSNLSSASSSLSGEGPSTLNSARHPLEESKNITGSPVIVDFKKYTYADAFTRDRDDIMTEFAIQNNIVIISPELARNEINCTNPFSIQLSTTSDDIDFLLEVSRFDLNFAPLQNVTYINTGSNVVSFLLPMIQAGDYGVRIYGCHRSRIGSAAEEPVSPLKNCKDGTHLVGELMVRFVHDVMSEEMAHKKYFLQSSVPIRVFSPKIQNFPLTPGYKYSMKFRLDNPENYPVMLGDSRVLQDDTGCYRKEIELTHDLEMHFQKPNTTFFRSFLHAKPVNDLKVYYGPKVTEFDPIFMKNSPVECSELFKQEGGRVLSHHKLLINSYDQVDCIRIEFKSADYQISASLYNTLGQLPERCVDVCTENSSRIRISTMYPRAGLYKLCIRLRSMEDDRNHDALFYWIEARGKDLFLNRNYCLFGFPERLYSCPLGVAVYSPQSLFLHNQQEHRFHIRLEKVYASTRLALKMSNGDVFPLEQSEEDLFAFAQDILFDRDDEIQEGILHLYESEEKIVEKSLIRFYVIGPRITKQYGKLS